MTQTPSRRLSMPSSLMTRDCVLLQWCCRRITVISLHQRHLTASSQRSGSTRLRQPEVRRRPLISAVHDDLHWLDVPDRIQFKLGVTVHCCLQSKAPVYLMYRCSRVADTVGRRHLRSASQHCLTVARYRLSTCTSGCRAFSVVGPAA